MILNLRNSEDHPSSSISMKGVNAAGIYDYIDDLIYSNFDKFNVFFIINASAFIFTFA
jgi:hypothetical protein